MTTGTTNTNEKPSVMEKVKAKVDNVLHKDKTHNNPTTTGTTTGSSGLVGEGQAGPHSSRAANAADPRFDSDLDGSHNAGVSHGTGHTAGSSALGSSGLASEGQAGPHSSRAANAADPRFDSDLDGSRNAGLSHGTGHSGAAGLGASGLGGSTTGHHQNTYTNNPTTTTGPHDSNLANKVDPRVSTTNPATYDSHTSTTNSTLTGQTGTRHTGGLSNSTNAGPHDSNLANKFDPRVDSDLDGAGNRHGHAHSGILGASGSHATRGSGTAQNTDGPHNSDRLNQLDPRVDSDRDASKTIGGNKTNY